MMKICESERSGFKSKASTGLVERPWKSYLVFVNLYICSQNKTKQAPQNTIHNMAKILVLIPDPRAVMVNPV